MPCASSCGDRPKPLRRAGRAAARAPTRDHAGRGAWRTSSPVSTGNVFPVFSSEALLGRFDSGDRDAARRWTSRTRTRAATSRAATRRLVIKDGKHFVAEEIGTMNGTFLNGKKLANGVLTPIDDGDELTLSPPGAELQGRSRSLHAPER